MSALRPTSWTGQLVELDLRRRRIRCLVAGHGAEVIQVMEHIAAADGIGRVGPRHVVDFANLDRRDVSIFGEAARNRRQLRPAIGTDRRHRHVGARAARDRARRSSICWRCRNRAASAGAPDRLAARRCPPTSAILAISASLERDVVLELLDAEVLLDEPRRHHPGARTEAGPRLDGARPGPDLFVGDERHRRDAAGPMALLTASLQDGRDVPGERDIGLGGGCRQAEERRDPENEPASVLRGHLHTTSRPKSYTRPKELGIWNYEFGIP